MKSFIILKLSLGISHSLTKPTKSSEESIPIKRQRSDGLLPSNNHKVRGNEILSKSISHDESTKKPKTNLFSQHNSLTVNINNE